MQPHPLPCAHPLHPTHHILSLAGPDDLSSCRLVLSALTSWLFMQLDAIFMLMQQDAHPTPSRAKTGHVTPCIIPVFHSPFLVSILWSYCSLFILDNQAGSVSPCQHRTLSGSSTLTHHRHPLSAVPRWPKPVSAIQLFIPSTMADSTVLCAEELHHKQLCLAVFTAKLIKRPLARWLSSPDRRPGVVANVSRRVPPGTQPQRDTCCSWA